MAVQLDQQLLDILACPSEDHAPLVVGTPGDPTADFLTCTSCHRSFPVRDGIPVLLLDEAVAPPPGRTAQDNPAAAPTPGSRPRPEPGPADKGPSAR